MLLAGCSTDPEPRPADVAATDATDATTDAAGGSEDAAAGDGCGPSPEATIVPPTAETRVLIQGDPAALLGTFDPSPVLVEGGDTGAMSYSAVASLAAVETRIAVTDDAGATWTWVANANQTSEVSLTLAAPIPECPSGTCEGIFTHEVSSLVHDPGDAGREWKLFAHTYVAIPGAMPNQADNLYPLGYIHLWTASAPEGQWADEGKALGWANPASDVSSEGAATLVTDFPEASDCLALTEPGALVHADGTIDLAVGCPHLAGSEVAIRVLLLRSTDGAATFDLVGVLLEGAEGPCLGGSAPTLNAPHLFVEGGATWLLVSPSGPNEHGFDGYRGCALLELVGDAVARDAEGRPRVERFIDGPGVPFVGACAYAPGAGYLVPQLHLPDPPVFRFYASGLGAP